jgi:NitT/TauT family transport system permease protein
MWSARTAGTDLLLIAALVCIWQAMVVLGHVDAIIAPSPAAVAADLGAHAATYLRAFLLTAATVIAGVALGSAGGAMLAVAAWWSTVLAGLTTPMAAVVRAMPLAAVLPLLTRVMGYGITTNLAIIALLVFFPNFILAGRALKTLPAGCWDLFKVLGATRGQTLVRLAIPAALPESLVAIKINATLGVIAGFGAEYITGVGGLGALYANERTDFTDPALGWSVAVLAGALTLSLAALSATLHRRVVARFS